MMESMEDYCQSPVKDYKVASLSNEPINLARMIEEEAIRT